MKKILIISMLLLAILLTGCGSNTPAWFDSVGQLSVTEIDTEMGDYYPYYYGKVENTGNCTVYNAMIRFKIYETSEKKIVIGTAQDYLVSGDNIKKGEVVTFEASALDLNSAEKLQYYTYEITFLEE